MESKISNGKRDVILKLDLVGVLTVQAEWRHRRKPFSCSAPVWSTLEPTSGNCGWLRSPDNRMASGPASALKFTYIHIYKYVYVIRSHWNILEYIIAYNYMHIPIVRCLLLTPNQPKYRHRSKCYTGTAQTWEDRRVRIPVIISPIDSWQKLFPVLGGLWQLWHCHTHKYWTGVKHRVSNG